MSSAVHPPEPRPLLDSFAFTGRLAAEVARLRRKGSLLSLLLMDLKTGDGKSDAGRLSLLAAHLRERVRLHDVLAHREHDVALLMPNTSIAEGVRAAERLLRDSSNAGLDIAPSAGLATMFDEAEGGREALVEAASAALSAARPGEIVQSPDMAGRPCVLIVDDDQDFAQVLAETVTERGWEGHPCSDTTDASERLFGGNYSALFIDVLLTATGGGIELLRRAMAYQPRRPVVLMSGLDVNHESIMEALELGPVMFIQKPISSADLDSALEMFRDRLPGAPAPRHPQP